MGDPRGASGAARAARGLSGRMTAQAQNAKGPKEQVASSGLPGKGILALHPLRGGKAAFVAPEPKEN